jgi:hypothetical protein
MDRTTKLAIAAVVIALTAVILHRMAECGRQPCRIADVHAGRSFKFIP